MKYTDEQIASIVSKLTLEQKASLCGGMDAWRTNAVESAGIPSITVSDGPHGMRLMVGAETQMSIDSSIPATCFPPAVTMACSWDEDMLREVGKAIAEEFLAHNVQVILGPGANIKRSPLCGRNFEYYSEDPLLSSTSAASFIEGAQSQGVGTSLKHFMANNQETNRYCVNTNIDERAIREIYLASFETAVKRAQPTSVMCSYNKLNGVQCSQNPFTLTEVLRDEWGFKGFVVSDWGAVDERVPALKAGLDLEMPSSGGIGEGKIIAAVKNGELDEGVLDTACRRLLRVIFDLDDKRRKDFGFDAAKHNATAAEMLRRSAVLLKNDNNVLPLAPKGKIAVIGNMAAETRIQGAGSSQVTPLMKTDILEGIRAAAPGAEIIYADGYPRHGDDADEALIAEAVSAAKSADAVVIAAGLPEHFESEGFDRDHMHIPAGQAALIKAVAAVQPNTALLLINGSPVELDFIENIPAVLELYLGGQAVGEAAADLIFGKVSPSGRLAETFPMYLENCNADIEYTSVDYKESVFVGYRWYSTKKYPVRFPFGYGLSYTSFKYSGMRLSADSIADTDALTVTVDVTNTGSMRGGEVVELYISKPQSAVKRPVRELRAYKKVYLDKGETQTVTFTLDKRAFAYWDTECHDWRAESGTYLVQLCSDCNTVITEKALQVEDTLPRPCKQLKVGRNTTLNDLLYNPLYEGLVRCMLSKAVEKGYLYKDVMKEDNISMFTQSPLRSVVNMRGNASNENAIIEAIAILNSDELIEKLRAGEYEDAAERLCEAMYRG